jgi:Domain of unknown function (DUF6745)
MITKLTKQQEEQLEIYKNKWLQIGLSTEPVTQHMSIIPKVYKNLLKKKPPKSIILMPSPLSAWLAISLIKQNQVENQVWDQVENQVWDQVENQVWDQVENQVWDQVRNQVRHQVRHQIRDQVWDQVENQVRHQVRHQVRNQIENQVWDQVEEFIWPYLDGGFSSNYFSFYDFCNIVLNISFPESWKIYKSTSQLSLIYPFDDICIVSNRPRKISMHNNVLHCVDGPAIQYEDDFSVYCLNGVKVTKEIVETPAIKLDPQIILTETNAEIRREIVKKIGIERVIQKLGAKSLDKWEDYELLEIKIPEMNTKARYLKMRNPSIGTWHVEGVPPQIKTCQEALSWRIGGLKWEPNQLT